MKKHLLIFLLLTAFCGKNSNVLNAQTLFNPTTYSGWVSTPTNSFATVPGAAGVTFTQISRGSGNSFSTASDGINSSKWNNASANAAIAANQFLTFSVSSTSTTTIEIDSLVLILGRSNSGPDSCILQYKTISSGANFTPVVPGVQIILSPSMSPTTTLLIVPPAPIQVLANDTLIFRLTAWHASSTLGTMKLMNNTAVYGKVQTVTSNSIAAPVVQTSGSTCVSAIQGDSIQVSFNSAGVFNNGNTFSLELSDAAGSFSNPVVIGNSISNLNNGTIQGFIPAGTASANYHLRITSSDPAVNGLDTTQLLVHSGIILNASLLQPDCPGSAGEIALTVNGGSGTIQYNWSNGATSQTISNLTAGTYVVTVSDIAGCSKDSSFAIQSIPDFLVEDSITDVMCNSGSTGNIQVSVSGGTAPYSISWTGNGINQTGLVASSLASGTYSLTLLDANNCPYTSTYVVAEPLALTAADSIVNVNCNSGSTGSIHLSVNGGTAPYIISWTGNGISQTGPVASNLPTGNYNVAILDAHNCVFNNNYTVLEPMPINISASVVHAVCQTCNGTITVHASGGVSPYSFLWDNNATTQTITAVPGQYCVEVSDVNACQADTCFTISSTAGIEHDFSDLQIQIFPNPASNQFQISFPETLNGIGKEVRILNLLGEVVLERNIGSAVEQETIHTDSWISGMYMYQISIGSSTVKTGKINILK